MTGHPGARDWDLDDRVGWPLLELEDAAERAFPGGQAVTVLFAPSEIPGSARLHGRAAAADLVRVFRALADRLERGELRLPLSGSRWGDEQYEA